jgi:hypothetical protein
MRPRRGLTSTGARRSGSNDRELAWIASHPSRARAWSESGRISTLAMATTLILGFIVHLVGYLIGTGVLGLPEWAPADLVSTLVSNLGIVLWTSVVLVVFLEILPAQTRRRARRAMALAAAALRDRGEEVPVDLLDAEDAPPAAAAASGVGSDRDRTLEAVLDRLTAIEQRLEHMPERYVDRAPDMSSSMEPG